MTAHHYDAIVIGGGLAGVITARILSEQRYRVLVVEKQPRLGQNNLSFRNARGEIFDQGYHALDENRSAFTTRFFAKVLDGRCHRLRLQRGIVVRGHLFDFNAPVAQWPPELAREFPSEDMEDSIEGQPSREALAKVYGDQFTAIAFDEILPSYPSLLWVREHGIGAEKLPGLIYPWFFPRARRTSVARDESGRFHESARQSGEHYVLYPDEGGFGAFIDGIASGIDESYATIRTGVADIRCNLAAGEPLRAESVQFSGVSASADLYFWCAPAPALAKLAGLPAPALHPQKLALGSYSFDRELGCPYHEILVGDPAIPASRISFPGKIAGGRNNLVQIEHFFPAGFREVDPAGWQDECLAQLCKLGVISSDIMVADYLQTIQPRGFVSVEDLHQTVEGYRKGLTQPGTNIHIPHLGLGPENINRVVPSVFRTVFAAITH